MFEKIKKDDFWREKIEPRLKKNYMEYLLDEILKENFYDKLYIY